MSSVIVTRRTNEDRQPNDSEVIAMVEGWRIVKLEARDDQVGDEPEDPPTPSIVETWHLESGGKLDRVGSVSWLDADAATDSHAALGALCLEEGVAKT